MITLPNPQIEKQENSSQFWQKSFNSQNNPRSNSISNSKKHTINKVMANNQKNSSQIIILNKQSKTKQKAQLKKIQSDAQLLKNRVNALKKHQEKQLHNIHKNQQMIDQVLRKKVLINQVNQYKYKNVYQTEVQLVLQKKRKNLSQKLLHQRQMSVILKALSIVKKQQANEIRNASLQHLKKIKEMREQAKQTKKQRQMDVMFGQHKSKVNYLAQIKEKLARQVQTRKKQIQEIRLKKNQQYKKIINLQEEQKKLMNNIVKLQSQSIQQKKRYFAALKVPAKKVADALGIQSNTKLDIKDHKQNDSGSIKRTITCNSEQISLNLNTDVKSNLNDNCDNSRYTKNSNQNKIIRSFSTNHEDSNKLKEAIEKLKQQKKNQRSL